MDNFYWHLVAGVAVTAACESAILNINGHKKSEILLSVNSKDRKYRADRMTERIVADIILKKDNKTGIFC